MQWNRQDKLGARTLAYSLQLSPELLHKGVHEAHSQAPFLLIELRRKPDAFVSHRDRHGQVRAAEQCDPNLAATPRICVFDSIGDQFINDENGWNSAVSGNHDAFTGADVDIATRH